MPRGGARKSSARKGQAFAKFGEKKRQAYLQLLREGNHRSTSARGVGVSPELVRLYRKKHSAFGEEEELAEMEAGGQVEDALFQAAISGNVTACQVWLYNRNPERWADRRNVNMDVKGAVRIDQADKKNNDVIAKVHADPEARRLACQLLGRITIGPLHAGGNGVSGQQLEMDKSASSDSAERETPRRSLGGDETPPDPDAAASR